jgi:hypothetical protein
MYKYKYSPFFLNSNNLRKVEKDMNARHTSVTNYRSDYVWMGLKKQVCMDKLSNLYHII